MVVRWAYTLSCWRTFVLKSTNRQNYIYIDIFYSAVMRACVRAETYQIILLALEELNVPAIVIIARISSVTYRFYRAMLCIRGTSHGPVSVWPSVTSRCSTKTAKRRITQTKPHDSPGTLVFWRQRCPRNSTGVTPYEGTECRWGGSKSATFD